VVLCVLRVLCVLCVVYVVSIACCVLCVICVLGVLCVLCVVYLVRVRPFPLCLRPALALRGHKIGPRCRFCQPVSWSLCLLFHELVWAHNHRDTNISHLSALLPRSHFLLTSVSRCCQTSIVVPTCPSGCNREKMMPKTSGERIY